MLGLYGRHAKQAAALRELLSDFEKTLPHLRVQKSDEGRLKECVAFFRAKLEFEANERQNGEAMQTFQSGRGPDEATEDPAWSKFRKWVTQARNWGIQQNSALEGDRRAIFLAESKMANSHIEPARMSTHVKPQSNESGSQMQQRHTVQASAVQKLLEELEKQWIKPREKERKAAQTADERTQQTLRETEDFRSYLRDSIQDDMQTRHYEDARKVLGAGAGDRPRSLLQGDDRGGENRGGPRGPLTAAEICDKAEQLSSGTDAQWMMFKDWVSEKGVRFVDKAVEALQQARFLKFGKDVTAAFQYAKIAKVAEPKQGESMDEILQRHEKEKKLVVEEKDREFTSNLPLLVMYGSILTDCV